METRQQLIDAFTTLLSEAEPAVQKATHLAAVLKLINSTTNKSSDTWQAPVLGYQQVPPGSPAPGDRYAVAAPGFSTWVGNGNKIATWTGSSWTYNTPPDGSMVYCVFSPLIMVVMINGEWMRVRIPQDQLYRTTGNVTTNSTSLAELGGLSGWVKPGHRYRVDLQLLVKSTDAAVGLQIGMSGPPCDAVAFTARIPTGNNTEQLAHGGFGAFTAADTLPASGVPVLITITGVVSNPAASDVITPLIASGSTGVTIVILPGSSMRITDITE